MKAINAVALKSQITQEHQQAIQECPRRVEIRASLTSTPQIQTNLLYTD